MCGVTREHPDGDTKTRKAMRCALPGFDRLSWDPRANPAAAADAELLADDIAASVERCGYSFELDRDGCPWAWAHCRYAAGVASFAGSRTLDSPTRTPSLRLTRRMLRDELEPRELLRVVELLEAYEDNAIHSFHRAARS